MNWLAIFFVNWLVNVLVMEFWALRKLDTLLRKDEARDSKFPAFRRSDIEWLNRPWLYMTCHFMLAKIIWAFFVLFICSLVCSVCVIGINEDEPITGIRYKINRTICWIAAWTTGFAGGGVLYVSRVRPNICYKKYLGPDWKPDYDSQHCGAVVSIHASLLEIAFLSLD